MQRLPGNTFLECHARLGIPLGMPLLPGNMPWECPLSATPSWKYPWECHVCLGMSPSPRHHILSLLQHSYLPCLVQPPQCFARPPQVRSSTPKIMAESWEKSCASHADRPGSQSGVKGKAAKWERPLAKHLPETDWLPESASPARHPHLCDPVGLLPLPPGPPLLRALRCPTHWKRLS